MQRNILNTYLHRLQSFKKMNSHYVVFSHPSFCILRHAATCTKRSHAYFIKLEPVFYISPPSKRSVHTSYSRASKEKSKVEETLESLKEQSTKEKATLEAGPASTFVDSRELTKKPVKDSPKPKRSIGKRILDEIIHYYHGFRLLAIDIKVATRMVWKILHGGELSRREHKQLVRTVSDIFRLVPFSVFILVPFMELLLPVFIKLFPQMLPSTFESASDQVSIMHI